MEKVIPFQMVAKGGSSSYTYIRADLEDFKLQMVTRDKGHYIMIKGQFIKRI